MSKTRRYYGQVIRRKGRWLVRWIERGRRRQKTIKGSKDLAERFLAKKQNELAEQDAMGRRPIEPITFERLLDRYEEILRGEKSPITLMRERSYLTTKALPFFMGMEMDRVQRADVERFMIMMASKHSIRPSTQNRWLSLLSRFWKKAIALGHARENPVTGIPRRKETLMPVPFLEVDDQERLIREVPVPLRWLVQVLLDTGLRLGEALRLQWADVDFRRSMVTVRESKTRTPREVPFTSMGASAFEARGPLDGPPRPLDLVFHDFVSSYYTGEFRLKDGERIQWQKARKRAGFPGLRLHDCRHIYAVTALRAGVPLGELRQLLGHKSLEMVLRYARHAPAETPDLARRRMEDFRSSGGHTSRHTSDPKTSGR